MSKLSVTIGVIVLCSLPSSVIAHHSRAEFSGELRELEGELVAINWVNPHPMLGVRLYETPGDVWEIQLYGSATSLGRAGIDASLFTVGERIVVAGLASSRRNRFLLGSHALLASGLETVFQYNVTAHWSGDYIGGAGGEAIDQGLLALASEENRGIFRVWSAPSTEDAIATMMASLPTMTPSALAARENWDDVDNPVTRCEEPWMPFAMMTPAVREFVDNDGTITLKIGYLAGGTRTIYLTNAETGDEIETSGRMGRSFGRWQGATLIVDTNMVDAPAFDPFGSMQSSELSFTEHFTLSDDQSRLDYELIMNDPVAFENPATFRFQYLALDEEFLPQC